MGAVESGSGAWTVPGALTANGYLDHAPLVSGPLADGSVLAMWTRKLRQPVDGDRASWRGGE